MPDKPDWDSQRQGEELVEQVELAEQPCLPAEACCSLGPWLVADGCSHSGAQEVLCSQDPLALEHGAEGQAGRPYSADCGWGRVEQIEPWPCGYLQHAVLGEEPPQGCLLLAACCSLPGMVLVQS